MSITLQLDSLYFDLKQLERDYNNGIIDTCTYIKSEQEINKQIDDIIFPI